MWKIKFILQETVHYFKMNLWLYGVFVPHTVKWGILPHSLPDVISFHHWKVNIHSKYVDMDYQ